MSQKAVLQCWNCGASLDALPLPLSRHDHCPRCFEAVHCCRLCRHYRADEPITCREDRADPPTIKENANFCDWFKPRTGAGPAPEDQRSSAAKARLDALFGADAGSDEDVDEAAASRGDLARARLDSLFGGADKDKD